MTLISHIEHALGEVCFGWNFKKDPGQIQVLCFENKPFERVVTYVTLGLSDILLPMPKGRIVRQELIFTAYDFFNREKVASFVLTFCNYIIEKNQALLRGDVIGPSTPLIHGVSVNSIYASIPSVFDREFATYKTPTHN